MMFSIVRKKDMDILRESVLTMSLQIDRLYDKVVLLERGLIGKRMELQVAGSDLGLLYDPYMASSEGNK